MFKRIVDSQGLSRYDHGGDPVWRSMRLDAEAEARRVSSRERRREEEKSNGCISTNYD